MAALDALYIKDAQTGALVPVAGDFQDDGSGTQKWVQALYSAFLDSVGAVQLAQDLDGQRMPTHDAQVLSALAGVLRIADDSPAVSRLNGGRIAVPKGGIRVVDARPGRKRLFMQHAGDQSGNFSFAQRIHLGWGATPDPALLPNEAFMDPGGAFDEYVEDTLQMFAMLDPSAADGTTQYLTFLELAA